MVSAWLWSRGNNGFAHIKLFDVLCKERRQLMGLFLISVVVPPTRFGIRVLWINALNVSGIIEVEALDMLSLCADE